MDIRSGVLTFFLIVLAYMAHSQQEAQVTQSMFNYTSVNPGYYGMREGICVTGLVRQQYVGLKTMEGDAVNPETFFLSVDAPVSVLRGALGGTIYQDQIGFTSNVGVELGYAYHTTLGYGDLGVGLNMGFFNETIDFSKFVMIDETDPVLENRQGEEQDMMINFSLGAFYQVENNYYLGVATTQMAETQAANTKYTQRRHYFLMGGYHYQLTADYEVVPSLMIQYDGATTQFHLSSVVQFKEKYWAGLGYRMQDAVTVTAGLYWKDFKFGYSYDLNTSRLAGAGSSGAYELMLGCCFKLELEKDNNKYRNTRFL